MSHISPLLPAFSFEEVHGSSFREMLYLVAIFYGTACTLSWALWKGVMA